MLNRLYIQHYTLIDELDINFREGFSVITGETGSGKSILLGAIGLLLGNRADSKSIQEGASKCVIEAEFCLKGYHLEDFFAEEGFDYDETSCIIRRELTSAGKSRAFINDSPASLTQLRALGSQLIDVHSQHQNMLLGQEAYQLSTLDIIAANAPLLQQYAAAYAQVSDLRHQLQDLRVAVQQGRAEQDYMQYQYQQLEEFAPKAGEDEVLEAERSELEHAEEIKGTLSQCYGLLDSPQESVLQMVNAACQQLRGIVRFFPKAEELSKRLEESYIELKDITGEVEDMAEDIEYNPERLNEVLQRIDRLYDLQQKHGATSAAELLEIMQDLEQKLATIDNADEQIQQLEKQLAEAQQRAESLAQQLTTRRSAAGQQLQQECNALLDSLGMPNGQVKVDIQPATELRSSGMDYVKLLFSGNKNGQLQAIDQVASGGEIARVMLALKCITSRHRALPTIIFDEIDTGVSGRIAEAMAHIMRQMAEVGGQVIAITHLPQIAALGAHQYKVYKDDDAQGTHSHMSLLSREERVTEVAKMLSGEALTQAAIDNAKQLLNY